MNQLNKVQTNNHSANRTETPPNPATLPTDELLTIAEVAAYLKLSRRTAWRWCKSGDLPAIKVGHQWRIARSDLEKFIQYRGRLTL